VVGSEIVGRTSLRKRHYASWEWAMMEVAHYEEKARHCSSTSFLRLARGRTQVPGNTMVMPGPEK